MAEWLEKMKAVPWIAHLVRMQERFATRLGSQFAAAVTYFSVLSMVPVLSFGFAILGLTLTVIRPDLLDQVDVLITDRLQGNDLGPQIVGVIRDALKNWPAVMGISLLTVAWAGAGWVANLKSAFRAQMRPEFDMGEDKSNIAVETLKNLGILLTMLAAILATFAISAVATSLSGAIITWLRLDQIPGINLLLNVVPILVSIVAGFLLFAFLFKVFAEIKIPRDVWLKASLAGSIGLGVLQYLATFLWRIFSGNAAAGIFGPVIVLMLFFNLFATLNLMLAAWMATHRPDRIYRSPLAQDVPDPEPEMEAPVPMVREAVAQQAMKVGMGTGYALGAATGVGIGAIIAGVLAWFRRLGRKP